MTVVGVIGMGKVGEAVQETLRFLKVNVLVYDKYKHVGAFGQMFCADFLFLCLPTPYSSECNTYDICEIVSTLEKLQSMKFNGCVVIKSTLVPGTCECLQKRFVNLKVCHNPEFLTSRTAIRDFQNQKHIVLGKTSLSSIERIQEFYSTYFPKACISVCTSTESETMKILCNSFYASKLTLFNEYYLLCQKMGISYTNVVSLMLKNGWINPMHTIVPWTDGTLGFSGACFPKDTQALDKFLQHNGQTSTVLSRVIEKNAELRKLNHNHDVASSISCTHSEKKRLSTKRASP